MRRITLIVVGLLLLNIILWSKPIPFDPSQGLVKIDVVIDGRIKGRFGIDTGADRLYMDKSFAEENGIDVMRAPAQRDVQSVDGSSKAYAASLSSFKLTDEAILKNVSATVIDMRKLTGGKMNGELDGLIGNRILRQFYVSVDFPHHRLELSTIEPDFLRTSRYEEINYTRYRDFIIVNVIVNGDTPVPMLFDYCSSHTVISRQLAKDLELEIQENNRITLPSIQLGEVSQEEVLTVVRDLSTLKKSMPRAKFDGIIGATFLKSFHVTVDYNKKKIYFQK